jgi:hypothetical protein
MGSLLTIQGEVVTPRVEVAHRFWTARRSAFIDHKNPYNGNFMLNINCLPFRCDRAFGLGRLFRSS